MSNDPAHDPAKAFAWKADLDVVVELMRDLSLQHDPQQAASLYAQGLLRLNKFTIDRYLSLSRRGLEAPAFRVTRNTSWSQHPNPWKERDRLPLLRGGMLADILYSNKPAVIDNLPSVLDKSDPAYELLHDMRLMVAMPHFEDGEAINAGLLLMRDAENFPFERIPSMVFQANLWGRATLNLLNQQRLQAAYSALDRELEIVANIQRSLLPPKIPHITHGHLAAHYQTSQRAGGDYYDFLHLPEDQTGIFVADVSGHGTPAAVLMAITHAIVHAHPGDPTPPAPTLAYINQKLATRYTNNNGSFVTAFYGIHDPHAKSFTYSSAGHPPPRLIRQGKVLGVEGENSLPLGVHGPEAFITHTLAVQPGDQILIYTDGITETFSAAGEIFGSARLDQACCAAYKHPPHSAQSLINTVLHHLQEHATFAPPTDDRTLVALQVG